MGNTLLSDKQTGSQREPLSFRSAPFFLTSTLYPPPFVMLSALRTIVEEMYVLLIEFGLSFLCDVASILNLKVMFFPCISNTSSPRLKIPHSLCCVPLVQLTPFWNVRTLAAADFTITRVVSRVLANSYPVPCSDQDYQRTICEQFSLPSACRKLYLTH